MKLKVNNWSYSTVSTYEKCPRMLYYQKTVKGVQKSSYVMERGIAIHAKGEQFLLGNISRPTKEFKFFAADLERIRSMGAKPEMKLCLDSSWKAVDWKDWKNGRLRLIFDAFIQKKKALIVDFKTGGIYDSHVDQASLYAASAMSAYDDIEKVRVEMWYVDRQSTEAMKWKRKSLQDLLEEWNARSGRLLSEKKWKKAKDKSACERCNYREICK